MFGCRSQESTTNPPGRSGPSVLLIVVDAASAEFFGCYGDPTGTSPNIDRLAAESVLFERAYSQTPTTVTSTASLLTGVRATTHHMTVRSVLGRRFRTAAERLKAYGFKTYGIIGNPLAGAAALGLARGYDACIQVYALSSLQAVQPAVRTNPFRLTLPEDINAQVFNLLAEFEKTGTFAYIHYLQPHKPYDPPESFKRNYPCGRLSWDDLHVLFELGNSEGRASESTIAQLRARYRANIRFVDAGLGALLDRLRREGLYDESLIILMSDHGDAFFKHRRFGHNVHLYDDMSRIPLMMKFPKRDGIRPRRIANLTETIDVLPTVFDYLGLPLPDQFEGESLWPLVAGETSVLTRPEVVTCTLKRNRHAIRLLDYKYIFNRGSRDELYNLLEDPDEQRNLIRREPEKAGALRAKLESIVDLTAGTTVEEEEDNQLRSDPRMDALLRSLGYTGESISDDDRRSSEPSSRGAPTGSKGGP